MTTHSPVTISLTKLAIVSLLALGIAACGDKKSADASAASGPAGEGACRLLSTSEVSSALSKSEPGVAEHTREQYGITACEWSTERGRFVAQYWKAENPSAKQEASGLMLGVVDPLKGSAAANVRYEDVQGVGEQAVAVIETADEGRGILSDMAMLVAQKGNVILVLIAPELTRVDRPKALQALQALGKSASEKLPATL
jgi:hypothetical protein